MINPYEQQPTVFARIMSDMWIDVTVSTVSELR